LGEVSAQGKEREKIAFRRSKKKEDNGGERPTDGARALDPAKTGLMVIIF